MDYGLVNLCRKWVEDKDASYLAQENVVLWFAKDVGLLKQSRWKKIKPREALRIISACSTDIEYALGIKEEHLIKAFQELGRTYEYGIRSQTFKANNVFNYTKHKPSETVDIIASDIAAHLEITGCRIVMQRDLIDIMIAVLGLLKERIKSKKVFSEALTKALTEVNLYPRLEDNRVRINGKLTAAYVGFGAKPAECVELSKECKKALVAAIYEEIR